MADNTVIILTALAVAAAAYLFGSISFSIIFTRIFIKKDIRSFGSGNAGMTNVFRSVGAVPGVLTLIGDFGKGILCALIGFFVFKYLNQLGFVIDPVYGKFFGGAFCFLGHIYPVYYGFKGGKGVLTGSGIMLIIDWRTYCIVMSVFFLVFLLTRIISAASLAAVGSFPIVLFLMHGFRTEIDPNAVFLISQRLFEVSCGVLFVGIIFIKHIPNIKRIIKGEEKQLKLKKKG